MKKKLNKTTKLDNDTVLNKKTVLEIIKSREQQQKSNIQGTDTDPQCPLIRLATLPRGSQVTPHNEQKLWRFGVKFKDDFPNAGNAANGHMEPDGTIDMLWEQRSAELLERDLQTRLKKIKSKL